MIIRKEADAAKMIFRRKLETGITYRELERASGVSKTTILNWMGRNGLRLSSLLLTAAALGLEIEIREKPAPGQEALHGKRAQALVCDELHA